MRMYFCTKRLIYVDDKFKKCDECIKKGCNGLTDRAVCIQKNLIMKEVDNDNSKF